MILKAGPTKAIHLQPRTVKVQRGVCGMLLFMFFVQAAFTSACFAIANPHLSHFQIAIQKTGLLLEKAGLTLAEQTDSSLFYAKKAYSLADSMHNDSLISYALLALGDAYYHDNNPRLALDQYLKAISLSEKSLHAGLNSNSAKTSIQLYNNIGLCYYDLQLHELAIRYLEQTARLIAALSKQRKVLLQAEFTTKVFYNISCIYIQMKKYEKAALYLGLAEELNERGRDSLTMAGILMNNGLLQNANGKETAALQSYFSALAIYVQMRQTKNIISLYNNIGEAYLGLQEYHKAIKYLNIVLDSGKQTGLITATQSARKLLAQCFASMGDFKKAYQYQQQFSRINDSLYFSDQANALTRYDRQYEFERQIKIDQLNQDELLHKQKTTKYFFFLLAIVFCLLSIIVALQLKNQRHKTRQEKLKRSNLELEQQTLTYQQVKLQNSLENKNRELAAFAIQMAHNSDTNKGLSSKIAKLKEQMHDTDSNSLLDSLITELQPLKEGSTWKEFEVRFLEVHPAFYAILMEKYPNLTANEKKMCAFLRLNMTTKEISAITQQSLLSLKMARARLRKKLQISPDVNLIKFLEILEMENPLMPGRRQHNKLN